MDIDAGNEAPKQDRLLESKETPSSEMTLRLSQEMVSLLSMMHTQFNRAISSSISDRAIGKRQGPMSTVLSLKY